MTEKTRREIKDERNAKKRERDLKYMESIKGFGELMGKRGGKKSRGGRKSKKSRKSKQKKQRKSRKIRHF
jgi:hypothetical protein